jgi:hypothetical protein
LDKWHCLCFNILIQPIYQHNNAGEIFQMKNSRLFHAAFIAVSVMMVAFALMTPKPAEGA